MWWLSFNKSCWECYGVVDTVLRSLTTSNLFLLGLVVIWCDGRRKFKWCRILRLVNVWTSGGGKSDCVHVLNGVLHRVFLRYSMYQSTEFKLRDWLRRKVNRWIFSTLYIFSHFYYFFFYCRGRQLSFVRGPDFFPWSPETQIKNMIKFVNIIIWYLFWNQVVGWIGWFGGSDLAHEPPVDNHCSTVVHLLCVLLT